MRRAWGMLTALVLLVGVFGELPSSAATVTSVSVLSDVLIPWGQPSASAAVDFPSGPFSKIEVLLSDRPDNDFYDRLFGVMVDGVELVRGTTPRADWSTTQDVTRYASLLSGHRTATVNLLSYQGVGHRVSLQFVFHHGPAPAGVASSVVSPFSFTYLSPTPDKGCPGGNTGDIDPSASPVISASAPFTRGAGSSATLVLYLTAHNCDEFFYTTVRPSPLRTVHLLIDGVEFTSFQPTPYVYALAGFSSKGQNTLLWWNAAQKDRERLGIHDGSGVIPPYSITSPALNSLPPGPHTLGIRIDNGSSFWVLSAELLL